MTDHTPEPLAYEIVPFDNEERAKAYSEWTGLYIGPDDLEGGILRTIFEGGFTHGPEDGDPVEDAKRLVACWNACAGIPTEQLGNVTALVLAARRVWSEIEETEYGCPTDVSDEAAGKLATALAPFRKD